MTCDRIYRDLPLYLYGELSQGEEELIEQHNATCADCTAQLAVLRSLNEDLTAFESPVASGLLEQCRVDIARAIRTEAPARRTLLSRLRGLVNFNFDFRVPAGALALVALGYFAGKVTPGDWSVLGIGRQASFVNVRSVEPDASGGVRVAFDDVNRKTLEGSLDDARIRELVLAAIRDDSNPGVRMEAIKELKTHAKQPDVRAELIDAMLHDPIPGVRMEALDAVSTDPDPAVRKALAETLLNDPYVGMRSKAIDILTAKLDASLIPTLQNLMGKERNTYILMRSTATLRNLKASSGIF